MMSGTVNSVLEARLPLQVQGAGGQSQLIDGLIDTGFSGSLTLPATLINTLGLVWRCRQRGLLADGRIHVFDVYEAQVFWDG